MSEKKNQQKIKTMRIVLLFSVVLTLMKFVAFFITHSNAILTDALESITNVSAGIFALFSIYLASQPKDENHPYGHGKIEFFSVGVEGGLILIAGAYIVVKSIYNFFNPIVIHSLDIGLCISLFTGFCNYLMGSYLVKQGKVLNSALMVADGKHLLSDTILSIGLAVGLVIIYFTQQYWIDNIIAIVLGMFILYMGYNLLKESINNLLDEADYEKLNQIINILRENRRDNWIDIHNLRILKYGSFLHVDAHITLPWYNTLDESHAEVSAVEKLIKEKLDGEVELFFHADPCLPISCPICSKTDCIKRKSEFVKRLDWTLKNVLPDRKHQL